MPVYASTPAVAGEPRHPKTLILIVAAHAVALAAVMSAKMDLPEKFDPRRTIVDLIPAPPPPPPPEPQPQPDVRQPRDLPITVPDPIVPTPPLDTPIVLEPTPLPPLPRRINPRAHDPGPPLPMPRADPVRTGPRFATVEHWLKPPYPPEKIRLEEEAALKLRLTIDERGRVVAVDPVGATDPSFLAAARKHILARWRYKPATEDGRAVSSSTVITLRFQLDS